ncbi:MAG: glycosyltransferase family 4 protein [Chloroflexi bacterium]|jgi:glycosyltransferase involved in cell wall biosynthesis|nr:glycosyltransferase family 4 protein [Chloroflexota bacterium]
MEEQQLSRGQLTVAVPDADAYNPHTGIGRVLSSLREYWGARVQWARAWYRALPLPILRNMPFGIWSRDRVDLMLLPQLTGAQALRNAGGVPSIVIVHDIGIKDYAGDRQDMSWLTYQTIMQSFWGLRHASHIIAVSQFTRDRLLHYLPELAPRVSVIPTGIAPTFLQHQGDKSASRDRLAQHVGHALGEPLLIYVGTEIARKNIPLLLQVFRQIKESYPDAQLIKVGRPGADHWRLRTLAEADALALHMGRDLIILEDVPDSLLADAYCAADVFLSTSLYEGFGLPALEAMAVGTPVIVTNRASFPEVVGQAGWAVPPDVQSFVQAIHAVLNDPHMAERAQQGQAHARSFTISQAAERYLQVMHQVAHR